MLTEAWRCLAAIHRLARRLYRHSPGATRASWRRLQYPERMIYVRAAQRILTPSFPSGVAAVLSEVDHEYGARPACRVLPWPGRQRRTERSGAANDREGRDRS